MKIMITFKGQFFPSQMRHCLLMDWALNYLHFSFCWLWIQTNPKLHLYILIENVLRDLSNNCFCRIVVATLRMRTKQKNELSCTLFSKHQKMIQGWWMRNFSALNLYHRIVHHHQRYRKNTFGNQYFERKKKGLHFPVFSNFFVTFNFGFCFCVWQSLPIQVTTSLCWWS